MNNLDKTYSIPLYENGIKTEWTIDGIIGDEKYQQLIKITPEGKLPTIINTTTKQQKVMKNRNIIQIDLSGCKNWNEAQKVIELVTSGKVKIKIKKI